MKDNESNRLRVLIEGIILGTLGFLAVTLFQVNGTVAKIEGSVESTGKRLDRIAQALPDLKVKIANEELRKPLNFAILTTEPEQIKNGIWETKINIINSKKNEISGYIIKTKDIDKRSVAYTLLGIAKEKELDTLSLKEARKYAEVTDNDDYLIYPSTYFDQNASFFIRNAVTNPGEIGMLIKSSYSKEDIRTFTYSLDVDLEDLATFKTEFHKIEAKLTNYRANRPR